MLIEFSVSNFRSIRERQTLSMVATPRLQKKNNVFKPGLKGEKFPDLLKVAVIYGPNASGKSNLLKALDVVNKIALREPGSRDAVLPVTPFIFDAVLANQPSLFELHFIYAGLRYQFNLAATKERIVGEKLLTFPNGRESLLYERQHTDLGETYHFGEALKIGVSDAVLAAWKQLTPPKLLFIAQAVANSSEELNQLKAPFNWLAMSSFALLNGMDDWATAAQRLAGKGEVHADAIASFLREVDVPIAGIRVEAVVSSPNPMNALDALAFPQEKSTQAPTRNKTILTHKTALGEADLGFEDESSGTKNLIGFWLPWVARSPSSSHSRLLIIDELDSSLHPKIVAALVEKHISDPNPSQLIFTTHDTHLMDTKLLRRDQFWITERDMNGATQLRSIHDFEGRDSEDMEKRYYEGRYRGLPLLNRGQ